MSDPSTSSGQALAKELIQRQESMAAERSQHESQWQEIAELMNPMRAEFTSTRTPGSKRTERIFDGTAGMAAENLGAGLYGLMTSPANVWFAIVPEDEGLRESREAKLWCDAVSNRMRNAFAANGNRFYTRVIDLFADTVGFGTGVFYVEELPERGRLFFSCRHLAECCIAESAEEQVDTMFRRFQLAARQARQQWGDRLSPTVARAAEKEPERKFSFLHAVLPADELPEAKSNRPFASVYVDVEGKHVLDRGRGYFEFPYQVPRWATRSRSVYGDGPGMLALPDAKMVNAMSKTTLVGAQKVVDPPILAPDEGTVRGVRTAPGQVIYGAIDARSGRALYQPLVTNARIELGLEMENQRRQAIREAFYWSLLLMIQQPNMTATEYLGRQEEKLRLMGPHLGRVQSEFLDPLIDRVFGIMLRGGAFQPRAGAFPAPPPELLERPALKVEYVSPLARAQKASEAGAIMRTIEAVTPIASVKPEVWDNFDPDELARGLADGFALPAKMQRDRRDVEALRQQRLAQSQAAALAAGAQPMAAAAEKIAKAGVHVQEMRRMGEQAGAA